MTTDTDTRNMAADYAATIAEELRTWERAANGDADALAAISADIDPDRVNIAAGELPHGDTYIESVALAVTVWRTGEDEDGMRETRVEIVRTYGGPSCRIDWDSRQPAGFDVSVVWGTDSATVNVYAPTLGDALADVHQ